MHPTKLNKIIVSTKKSTGRVKFVGRTHVKIKVKIKIEKFD